MESIEQLEMKAEVVENPSTTIDVISSLNCGNNGGSDTRGSTHSNSQRELNDSPPTGHSSSLPLPASLNAPVKKLTLFALRLAIIEKTAYGLGKLAFIWASVVLLGGYASALKPKDFWFVTGILIVEGARIFSHSLELDRQYQSTHTLLATPSHPLPNYMLQLDEQQTWLPENVHLLPHWVFVSKNISYLLHWLQILGATACAALSLMRLGQQDFGEEAQNNQKSVLIVFYILALAEALMFLFKNGYWTWTIEHRKLFMWVIKELELGPIGIVSLRLFFYDAHSKCISGSIFDGLKMDLISFAEKLLDANSLKDQIIGAKILQQFIKNKRFSVDTLRKIGSSAPFIRRLIEMLNWRYPEEKDIRLLASNIVAKLTSQHTQLVVVIPGVIESIASLLQTGEGTTDGLSILKHLARDHVGCQMIQNQQGLLARIIDLTSSDAALLHNEHPPESPIKAVRRALKVVKNLVSVIGETGRALRRDISKSASLMSNIEKSLQHEGGHLDIQMLGLGILSRLGVNDEVKKNIGNRYRMLRLIFEIFFQPIVTEEVGAVCNEAGEVLAVLVLHSSNYVGMLRATADVLERLVAALSDPVLRVNATRILRGLLANADSGPLNRRQPKTYELQIVAEKMPMVLKTIMEEKENEKLLEASIGLAEQILKSKKVKVNPNEIERAEIKDEDFVGKLVEILRIYDNLNSKVPEMRIFVIGLATTLMEYDRKYIKLFKDSGMKQILIREDFNLHSFDIPDSGLDEAELKLWEVTRNWLMKLNELDG